MSGSGGSNDTSRNRARHAAGMSPLDAARDMARDVGRGPFADWGEAERLVVNVAAVYRELGEEVASDAGSLFAWMAELAG